MGDIWEVGDSQQTVKRKLFMELEDGVNRYAVRWVSMPNFHFKESFGEYQRVNERSASLPGPQPASNCHCPLALLPLSLLAYHFGEDPAGFFPQVIVHISCSLEAQRFLGDHFGFFQGD